MNRLLLLFLIFDLPLAAVGQGKLTDDERKSLLDRAAKNILSDDWLKALEHLASAKGGGPIIAKAVVYYHKRMMADASDNNAQLRFRRIIKTYRSITKAKDVPAELIPKLVFELNEVYMTPGAEIEQIKLLGELGGRAKGALRALEWIRDKQRDDVLATEARRAVAKILGLAPAEENLITGKSPNPFVNRTGEFRKLALQAGGGTVESEAAVALGLKWIVRQQSPDGHWALDGRFKDKGTPNDIAGTAFGLLPLLGAGYTHKAADDNPYDKAISKGLNFLMKRQDIKRGDFGGGGYSHALASIAMCEAYGLTKDAKLRPSAQRAINFIVFAQHPSNGGWRYAPGQEGDTSVTAWQVTALMAGHGAGLDVPAASTKGAIRFLDSCMSPDDLGYGYTGVGSTPTMSAAGLLCRQKLQGWEAEKREVIDAVKNHIRPAQPNGKNLQKNIYFYYYATQVMHQYSGEAWKKWNEDMRDGLVAGQEQNKNSANLGSWSSAGDPHAGSGGRLMITSLNLLTLEVYYRYRREASDAKK
jgi:hypothetical protein